MIKKSKKVMCLIATIAMCSMLAASVNVNAYNKTSLSVEQSDTVYSYGDVNEYGLAAGAKDGCILHAWNWHFSKIKGSMKEIAEAGFTAVQTSPLQPNKDGSFNDTAGWWKFYQPYGFSCGNTLGSAEDFKSMCDEADKYGIKVIVDVVANHLANVTGKMYNQKSDRNQNIQADIRDNDAYWHNNDLRESSDGDRYVMTNAPIGMPDLNTSNEGLQKIIFNYLNEAQKLGADGFRFDAAKHIELPEDNGFGSNFWPNLVTATKAVDKDVFLYGEILNTPGPISIDNYTKRIRVTNNKYGQKLRDGVTSRNAGSLIEMSNNEFGRNASTWITWVESHDTFSGKYGEHTSGYSTDDINYSWYALAARADAVPLYFARPKVFQGTNSGAAGFAGSVLGEDNGAWKDKGVAEVNRFHNYFAGTGEYASTLCNNRVFAVERGATGSSNSYTGIVLVNLDRQSKTINESCHMKDGNYIDQMTGNEFTVSGGKISGTIGDKGVAVVYNATPSTATKVSASVASGTSFTDSLKVTLNAKNTTSAKYSVDGGSEESYTDGKTITVGENTKIGGKVTLKLTGVGESGEVTETYTYTKKDPNEIDVAYLKKPASWDKAYIYIYDDDKTITDDSKVKKNAEWPGLPMTKVEGDLYKCEIPSDFKNARVIFTNGEKSGTLKYPADTETEVDAAGLTVDGSWIYDGTSWKEYITSSGGDDPIDDPVEDIKAGKISFSLSSPQEEGTSIKITTAAATGGSGDYSYQFECDDEIIQEYSNSKTATWKPDKEGSYTIKVTVKDSEGNTDSKTATYKITSKSTEDPDPDENEYTITIKYIDKDTGKAIRSAEKITGKEGESYKIVKKSIDGYTFKSYIGDLSGTFSEDATVTLKYVKEASSDDNNNDNEEIVIDSFKATTSKTNIETGTIITFKVSASGGSGTLQYTLKCIKDGENKTIKDYSTKTSLTWTPEEEGTYKIYVMVKDDNDNTTTSEKLTYTVKDEGTSEDPADTGDVSNVGLIISVLALAGISMKRLKK